MPALPYWRVDPIWRGDAVAVIGAEVLLDRVTLSTAGQRCRTIAVDGALEGAPFADLHLIHHLSQDQRGAGWYRAHAGIRATVENPELRAVEPAVRGLRFAGTFGLCREPDGVCTGEHPAYVATNLAMHLGARRVVLMGFSQRPREVAAKALSRLQDALYAVGGPILTMAGPGYVPGFPYPQPLEECIDPIGYRRRPRR